MATVTTAGATAFQPRQDRTLETKLTNPCNRDAMFISSNVLRTTNQSTGWGDSLDLVVVVVHGQRAVTRYTQPRERQASPRRANRMKKMTRRLDRPFFFSVTAAAKISFFLQEWPETFPKVTL
jgi:hypothetical protein